MVAMTRFKRSFASLMFIALIFNIFISFPAAQFINIYEEKQTQNLSTGVVHERILRFTDKGWLNLNVLKIDLDDRHTSLDILTDQEGISTRDTLTNLAAESKSKDKIVGAINGDFFDTRNFATMGPVIEDGELITTSINDPSFAAFNINEEGYPFLDYWTKNSITLENEENDFILNINYKNKPYIDEKIVLLDKNWGKLSLGNAKTSDIIEMVIVNDEVEEIRINKEAIAIPEDGYIISAAGNIKEYILNNFSVGDEVSLKIETKPDFENLKLAMGGGSIILKDGKVLDNYTLKIPGRHPRSALGISKNKDEIILVTVDGRTSSYPGVTQYELGEILLELGAYDGINLDGGGSSEMIVRNPGENNLTIANNPSGGFERKLLNGLAVLNDSPKSYLKDIIISCEDTNIFVDTSRELQIKGYDRYYNPVDIDLDEVSWNVSGIEGKFINNKFIPSSSGKGTITAHYKGKTATLEVKALSNPIKLEISPSKIFIDEGGKTLLSASAVNDEGYRAKIDINDLIWNIPGGLGDINDNTFTASDNPTNGIMKASFKNIDAYIQVAIGYKKTLLEGFEKKNAEFLAFPQEVKGSFDLSSTHKNGSSSGKISYDFTGTEDSRAAYIVFENGGLTMETKPVKLGLWVYGNKGNAHWLRGKITDSKGNSFTIDFSKNVDWQGWKFVEANIPANATAPLKLERLYLVEIDPCLKDSGYIYVDDLIAFYKSGFPEAVPENNTIYLDKRNVNVELENENSFRFLAHGSISEIDTLLDNLVINDLAKASNSMDMNIFSNFVDKKLRDQITKPYMVSYSGHSIKKFKDSTFITLDNSQGGLRNTDYNQWIWLLEKVEEIDSKSLFVILPKPLNFSDTLEEKLFMDTFTRLKEEKNMDIWIFTGGDNKDFEVTAKNGIRLVKLKSYPSHNKIDIFNELKYMVFTVNDGYVTYQIKNMYE